MCGYFLKQEANLRKKKKLLVRITNLRLKDLRAFPTACLILLLLIQIPAWISNLAQNRFNWLYLLFLSSFIIPWEMCIVFLNAYCILWSVKNVSDLNMHLKVKKTFPINSSFFSYLWQVERLLQVCWMCYVAFTMRKRRNRTMHFYSKVSQMEATKHAKQEKDFKVLLRWLVHILADLCLYSH